VTAAQQVFGLTFLADIRASVNNEVVPMHYYYYYFYTTDHDPVIKVILVGHRNSRIITKKASRKAGNLQQ
jgi:hypothetical protein